MSRQQNFSRQHFGADDHSNPRGGYSRGGGNPQQQWRGGTGGERSDYFSAMDDERNFGSYEGGQGRWNEDRQGYSGYPEATSYGREMGRGGGQGRFHPDDGRQFGNQFGEDSSRYGGQFSRGGQSGYGEEGGRHGGQQDFGRWGGGSLYQSGMGGGIAGGMSNWGRGMGGGTGNDYGSPQGQQYRQQAGSDYYSGQRMQRRGQMPKGYTRSDDRIKDDIIDRLCNIGEIDLSEVNIEVKNGTVTLTGSVSDRRMKHRIEDICEDCLGVNDVENRVRVSRGGDSETGSEDQRERGTSAKRGGSSSAEARH